MAASPPCWTVYVRSGCSLCDEMCAELGDLLGPRAAPVSVINIDGDPDLERRFGHRIPVLAYDDEFVCAYRLDADRVRGYLTSSSG